MHHHFAATLAQRVCWGGGGGGRGVNQAGRYHRPWLRALTLRVAKSQRVLAPGVTENTHAPTQKGSSFHIPCILTDERRCGATLPTRTRTAKPKHKTSAKFAQTIPINKTTNCQINHAPIGGVFAQRGHSANHYVVYPGNTPENHPPTEACMIHSNSIGGAEFRTLGPMATGGEKRPTFRTAHAQRAHSAWCAPISNPPGDTTMLFPANTRSLPGSMLHLPHPWWEINPAPPAPQGEKEPPQGGVSATGIVPHPQRG